MTVKFEITVNLNLTGPFADSVLSAFGQLVADVEALKVQGAQLMTQSAEIKDLVERLDAATNEVAKDVADLQAQLGDKLTPEEMERFTGIVGRLEKLGADTDNPVPA